MFYKFQSVFTDKEAPNIQEFVRISDIVQVSINTDVSDTENTGPYYVWLTLSCGTYIPCFIGTADECDFHLGEIIEPMLVITSPVPVNANDIQHILKAKRT